MCSATRPPPRFRAVQAQRRKRYACHRSSLADGLFKIYLRRRTAYGNDVASNTMVNVSIRSTGKEAEVKLRGTTTQAFA
jgi:hypothetical protein